MKSLHKTLFALAIAAALTLSVSAQQPSTNNQPQNQDMQDMQGMQGMQGTQSGQMHQGQESKDNMMQSCQKNMQTMMQSTEQLKKTIADAKASNDAAKMQSALGAAEKYVDSRNDDMKTCMNTMNMMESKNGMCGMMKGDKRPAQNLGDAAFRK